MKGVKVIIYNDKEMMYREGVLTEIESNTNFSEESWLDDSSSAFIHDYTDTIICRHNGEKQSIKLDPTTMIRIAKYNKEVEIEKLDEIIKLKQKKIEELDDILQDKDQRVEKIREYIRNIYDIDISNDEEDEWDDEEDEWDDEEDE